MRAAGSTTRTATDRFVDVVDGHLAPALAAQGFERQQHVLERDGGDVRWVVEVELAPWTTPERICFTLAWGVAVPGLEEILDDPVATPVHAAECHVSGRLGERAPGLEASWLSIGPVPRVPGLERVADARTAQTAVRLVHGDLLPALGRFDSIPAVQAHLVEHLVRGRGAARHDELRRVRWIAGLSLLLGERGNASRWLDYLEARSSRSIAPDVVAENLASLRERCAS